jgi:hypothetical protein
MKQKELETRADDTQYGAPLATAGKNEAIRTINLNDYVLIQLRPKGRVMLAEQDARWSKLYATTYGRLPTAEKQEADNDGWSRWQLWSLIEAFGPALYLGCDPPFETTIRIEPKP